MSLDVIVLGPPGSGKGTQSERLARRHAILRISTGDILREAVHMDSSLGRAVKDILRSGGLVEDSVMIAMVRERLSHADATRGFVLDGFPRTVGQAQALDTLVAERGPLVVVNLMVPLEELVRRLSSRRICGTCGVTAAQPSCGDAVCGQCGGTFVRRDDDDPAIVRARLQVHADRLQPLVNHYRERRDVHDVDGTQSPEEVGGALDSIIAAAERRWQSQAG